jgi:hypothetical protein
MRGRLVVLILLAGLVTLLAVDEAQAHRLDADSSVKLVQKVRIESYFSDDSRPKGAKIQVFRADETEPFREDRLDDEGAFEFLADLTPLRVVIQAGEGHTKELLIGPALVDASSAPPPIEHKTTFPVVESTLGLSFLLALSAFILSLRNARRLREMRRERGELQP